MGRGSWGTRRFWGLVAWVALAAWVGGPMTACGADDDKKVSSPGGALDDASGKDLGQEDGVDSGGGSVTVDGHGGGLPDGQGADADAGMEDGTGAGEVTPPDVGPEPDLPQPPDVPESEAGHSGDIPPDQGDSQGAGDVEQDADTEDVADGADEVNDAGDDASDGADAVQDVPEDTGPELPQIVCGDGVCDPSEDACGCPDDCGCGDGTCDHTETWLSCPEDCGSCGDGRCGPDEDQALCPVDCGSCGDGTCDLLEDGETCPDDCGACPPVDYACADATCFPWIEAAPGTDVDPSYALPCGTLGASLTMDLATLGDAKRLLASVNGPPFYGLDTALAAYTDFSAMCASAATAGGAPPDACVDPPATAGVASLLLSDVPRSRVRFVGYSQPGSDQTHTLSVTAFYGPGEPCVPGPSLRGCFAGECVAACSDASTGRCPDIKDCADGIDSDGDGLTDEDDCTNPPHLGDCPSVVDGKVHEAALLGVHVDPGPALVPTNPWVEVLSTPPGSSGDVLPAGLMGTPYITPDVDGAYVVRATYSNADAEQVACETTVNVGDYDCLDGIDNDGDGLTDEQWPLCDDWSGVVCPADTVVTGLGDVALSATGFGGLDGQPLTWSVAGSPPGAAPQITAEGGTLGAGTFTPDQPGLYTLRAEGVVPGTVNHFACETHVLVTLYDCADGIDADRDGETDEDAAQCAGAQTVSCSADATVPVLQTATTDTHTSAAVGEALGALWSLEEGPPAWYLTPTPPAGASQTCDDTGCTQPAALDLLMTGPYRVRYMTVDAAGHAVGCEQTLTTSIPDGLRVELTWNPDVPVPLDTSDVDLHLRHPSAPGWFDEQSGLDCYYATCVDSHSDWGADGDPDNDPRLDVDDVEGHGPENINIRTPDVGATYRLGVHLFDADHTPLSTSRVRIFCAGALVADLGPLTLPQDNPTTGGAPLMFWEVATITFDAAGSCTVTPLGALLTNGEAGY